MDWEGKGRRQAGHRDRAYVLVGGAIERDEIRVEAAQADDAAERDERHADVDERRRSPLERLDEAVLVERACESKPNEAMSNDVMSYNAMPCARNMKQCDAMRRASGTTGHQFSRTDTHPPTVRIK